jgi:hypothetical protein
MQATANLAKNQKNHPGPEFLEQFGSKIIFFLT